MVDSPDGQARLEKSTPPTPGFNSTVPPFLKFAINIRRAQQKTPGKQRAFS
jgi:hypothetical protein